MNATVKDVMTTEVITVSEDTAFEEIAQALGEHRVSAFPVVDRDSRVIGLVSESDLLAKLAVGIGEDRMPAVVDGILHARELNKARAVTARQLMTAPVITVLPDDPVELAARLMYNRNVKRLPVTDADGHLTGIVSRSDVLAVYTRGDAEIASEIRTSVFPGVSHEPGRPFDVSVRGGVVTIFGAPLTAAGGRALLRQARLVEGVVTVRDRLDYPAPEPDRYGTWAPRTTSPCAS